MPDPTNPNANNPMATGTQGMPTDPNAAPPPGASSTPAAGGSDFLTTIGGDLSTFLNNNAGNLATFGTLAGLGLSEASSQKSENASLASSIASKGAPFSAAGEAELSQITGGPQMGGPLGASIADQTTAAAELGGVAKTYGTGNLTPAQQTQVQQQVAAEKAKAASELAGMGITDPNSDQYVSRMQQIDDNAKVLAEQLIQQNTSISEGALNAVQTTYSNLLNQSLSSANFGLGAQTEAVTLQIQQDTALAGQLEQLFSGIAQGFGNAIRQPSTTGTPAGGGTPVGQQGGGSGVGQQGTGAGVATSAPGGGTSDATLRNTGGANSGIASGGLSPGDQAIIDQNNQGFVDTTDQIVAGDTTAQDQINQYADQFQLPDVTGGTDYVSSDIPSYTSDGTLFGDVTGDPFGGLGG